MSVEYSEDRLIQKTTADYFSKSLKWESVYAYNDEVLGKDGTLGHTTEKEVVLARYLLRALEDLNPGLPGSAHLSASLKI